jgi:haloalkane dehalogenase
MWRTTRCREEIMLSNLEWYRQLPVKQITTPLVSMGYRCIGQGPDVVMVHGWPLSGITFRATARALSERYRIWLPDLPGAGSTPYVAEMGEFFAGGARVLRDFVDAAGLGRFALIGHDSGGAMARMLAADAPDRVTAMVLAGTEIPGHVPSDVRRLQRMTGLPFARGVFKLALRSKFIARSSLLGFGLCFGDRARIDGEFRQACVEPLTRDVDGAFMQLASADLDGTCERLIEVHSRIVAPTQLVWGERDSYFPLGLVREKLEPLPWVRGLTVVAGNRLLVHEESPEVFTRAAFDLLDSVHGRTTQASAQTHSTAAAVC